MFLWTALQVASNQIENNLTIGAYLFYQNHIDVYLGTTMLGGNRVSKTSKSDSLNLKSYTQRSERASCRTSEGFSIWKKAKVLELAVILRVADGTLTLNGTRLKSKHCASSV